MADLVAKYISGDVSALNALLLVALFLLVLKAWKDLGARLDRGDRTFKRLGGFRQNHETRLALIEEKVGIETRPYHAETDDE